MSEKTFIEGQGWKVRERFQGQVTPEGGRGLRLTNRTGAASKRGTIVSLSNVYDRAVMVAPANSEAPMGVIYDNDIPDGEECFVVTEGFAEVLIKDATACVAGNWAITSDTPGRSDSTSTNPIPASHWREIGHCAEAKDAGVDVLSLHKLHFN